MKKTEVAVKEKSSVDVSVAGQHDWSILGKSVVKKDTMEKIMGSAKFAADMELPNMLYGGVFRSTICHCADKQGYPRQEQDWYHPQGRADSGG